MNARASAPSDAGFGIYVHWPFCQAKCPYCDFNSHVRTRIDQGAWAAALCRELDHVAARTDAAPVDSVFFGGGTPSLMEPETVAAILARIAHHWPLGDDQEITLEANPTSVEARRFAGYRAAGVNRLSLGVQALDDDSLKALGRRHTVAEALAALDLARTTFPRISFDLIYARPGQSAADWKRELGQALGFAPDHLSLYQLTIEDGTPFAALHAAGKLSVPGEDLAADLYDLTQDSCTAVGLPAYEISNHARPGAACRHNLIYWRGGAYVGIGPGAHGRLQRNGVRIASETERNPESWLAQVARAGHGLTAETPLCHRDVLEELVLMGLRLAEGINTARIAARTGAQFDEAPLGALREGGLVWRAGDRLGVTARGRVLLNAVILEVLDAFRLPEVVVRPKESKRANAGLPV